VDTPVHHLPHLMSVQRVGLSLTAQIRRRLQEAENVDDLPLSLVAHQLNRREDTERRHLKVEGGHFSEPSSFNRAFKRWTGHTPGDCRKQVA
jgi:hypothetical protein